MGRKYVIFGGPLIRNFSKFDENDVIFDFFAKSRKLGTFAFKSSPNALNLDHFWGKKCSKVVKFSKIRFLAQKNEKKPKKSEETA